MKSLIILWALSIAVASLSACTALTPEESDAVRVMSGSEQPQPTLGAKTQQQSAKPDSNGGKTRAEVYQELIDSERSGEMEYLNSTLYAH